MIDEVMIMISIFITVPVIWFNFSVLNVWGEEAFKAFIAFKNTETSPTQWLIMGVFIAFFGSLCSNIYWFIWWSFCFYSGLEDILIYEEGLFLHFLFRQIIILVSAICHIKAYEEFSNTAKARNIWFVSSIVGLVYIALLSLLKR